MHPLTHSNKGPVKTITSHCGSFVFFYFQGFSFAAIFFSNFKIYINKFFPSFLSCSRRHLKNAPTSKVKNRPAKQKGRSSNSFYGSDCTSKHKKNLEFFFRDSDSKISQGCALFSYFRY